MTERLANILLVDDDSNFLTAMEDVLAGPGRTIFKAQSGNEALRCLLQRDFALILLDVRMPGLDGFEAADMIRQRARSRYTPIIFMSGSETVGKDVMYGIAKGAVDYILKPFTLDLLKFRVSTFVDLFHLHERLKQEAVQPAEDAEYATPILTLRTGLLLVPITGLIDQERFNRLENRLFQQMSETQAKAVIIDVTGASIDIDVIQAIKTSLEAAQQRTGARIIFTGSNTSISNAMFVTNTKLDGIVTADSLQAGIHQAERLLSEAGGS